MKKFIPLSLLLLTVAGFAWLQKNQAPTPQERFEKVLINYQQSMTKPSDFEEFGAGYTNARMFYEFDRMKRINPQTGEIPAGAERNGREAVMQLVQEHENSSRKTNNALFWDERGPDNIGGRSRALLWDPNDPNDQAVFAGGVGGGLWHTPNIFANPVSWTSVTPTYDNVAVTCIGWDRSNPQIMYYGTGEGYRNLDAQNGAGIWKSTDGGMTWAVLPSTEVVTFNFSQGIQVNSLGHVFVATKGGLQKSTDGGMTWTKVLGQGTGLGTDFITDVEIAANGDLFVAIESSGVYKAEASQGANQGDVGNWTRLSTNFNGTGGRTVLGLAPGNADYLYALVELNNTIDQIYRSTNGGSTWSPCATEPNDDDPGIPATDASRGQAWYDLSICVDPNDPNTLFVGGVDLFKSTNGGNSWNQVSHWYGGFGHPYVHADQHNCHFRPGSSSNVLFSHDGGVSLSTNGGNSFLDKNNGYNVTQFYTIAVDPFPSHDILIGGAQDNGTILVQGNSQAGDEISGGDGAYCDIHPFDPDTMYVTSQYASLRRSRNGGQSFANLSNFSLSSSNTMFINPIELDEYAGDVLYQASHALWRNNSAATSRNWVQATKSLSVSGISAITTSPSVANLTYFAAGGTIYRLPNSHQGNFLTDPDAVNPSGIPSGYVSDIAVDPTDANHIAISFTSYGISSHVMETRDAQNGPNATWKDLNGNLPDIPTNTVIFEPGNPDALIIGTDFGAFRCGDITVAEADIYWSPERTGMGLPRVDMLRPRRADNTVHAGTHGRGFFSTNSLNLAPIAGFGIVRDSLCAGEAQFIDSTFNAPTSWFWDFGDGTTSTLQSPVHEYLSSGTYQVSLTVSNAQGTDSTSGTYNVVVLPPANVVLAQDTIFACPGDSIALMASGGVSYQWFPDANLDHDDRDSVNTLASTSRMYTVEMTDVNGCTDLDTVHIEVLSSPPIWAGQDQTITQVGDSVQLMGDGGVNYIWSPATGLSCTNCPDPMASPDSTTTYTLTGFGANGCSRTDQVIVRVNIVGLEEPVEPDPVEFGIFPNPFGASTSFALRLPESGEVALQIVDLQGRTVQDFGSRGLPAGPHRINWNTGTLPAGIYYARLSFNGRTYTQKLVRQP